MAEQAILRLLVAAAALLFAPLSAAAGVEQCQAEQHNQHYTATLYPQPIEFDVLRNGKNVGSHQTSVRLEGDYLKVSSAMSLGIEILFIPVYSFSYESESLWCGGTMLSLDAKTDDGGEVAIVAAERTGEELRIKAPDKTFTSDVRIPTDHWNASVLNETQVLNTITGNVNQVSLAPCEQYSARIKARLPGASCHQYHGELDARVWYDTEGRWVGLEFPGRDGSQIEYLCRSCNQHVAKRQ